MSYREGEGIKLSCQLVEDKETCDRLHLVCAFACWIFINVCHLPFKDIAKKDSQKRRVLFPLFWWMHCGKLGSPLGANSGKLSWVLPQAGRSERGGGERA